MKMELANAFLALNGDRGTVVQKQEITPAEALVMQYLHGADAVFDIDVLDTLVERTARAEIVRLTNAYGRQDGETRISPAVRALFPGAKAQPPMTFSEIEFPEELFINNRIPAPALNAQSTPLEEMTVNALRAHADKLGISLDGIVKKADIVEAIKSSVSAVDALF